MDIKIYGQGNYEIKLHYYGYGEWNRVIYRCKTFKTAYRKARLIQRKYNGSLYCFYIFDHIQCKVRWWYNGETSATKWCNIHYLRQGRFDLIR